MNYYHYTVSQILIRFLPQSLTTAISPGATLLDAARRAGIQLADDCNGQGDCGQCWVILLEGEVTPPTQDEKRCQVECGAPAHYRLACCTRALASVNIFIPEESLKASPRHTEETQIDPWSD